LTSAERAELAGLKAWLAAAPDSLKAQVDDPELREFLVEDVWGGGREAPAQPAQRDEDSAGHRKLAKRHAPASHGTIIAPGRRDTARLGGTLTATFRRPPWEQSFTRTTQV
jgi:hypothetical protein